MATKPGSSVTITLPPATPAPEPKVHPVGPGYRTSGQFGEDRGDHSHGGIDFANGKSGGPVYATHGGTAYVKSDPGGFGTYVLVVDGNTQYYYGHLSATTIKSGQVVQPGQQIGNVGNTGRSSGPHLHYEVRENGTRVDPRPYLNGAAQPRGGTVDANTQATGGGGGATAGGGYDSNLVKATPKNGNRNWASEFEPAALISALNDGSWYQDNTLNQYENFSYHWRMFMIPDIDIITAAGEPDSLQQFYDELSKYQQTTVAESGVTRYMIESVSVEGLVGTDSRSRSARFTSMQIKIAEPNGVGFLDNLKESALNHTIRNYHKCPYYLELTFKAYDDQGNIVAKPLDGENGITNGGKWIFAVQITNIEVNISAAGGSYTLDILPYSDVALDEQFSTISSTIEASGPTVGSVLSNVAGQLNRMWANKYLGTQEIVKHSFQVHGIGENSTDDMVTPEQILAWPVTPKNEASMDEAFSTMHPSIEVDPTRGTLRANIGARIQDLVTSIFSSCPDAELAAWNLNGNDEVVDRATARIEAEVRYPDYHSVYGMYYHHITWHIFFFRSHTAIVSHDEVRASYVAENQREMLLAIARKGFLLKRYEYLFTGHNTEVIDLDLGFKLAWSALLPKLIFGLGDKDFRAGRAPASAGTTTGANPTSISPAALNTESLKALALPDAMDSLRKINDEFERYDWEKVGDATNKMQEFETARQNYILARSEYEAAKAKSDAKPDDAGLRSATEQAKAKYDEAAANVTGRISDLRASTAQANSIVNRLSDKYQLPAPTVIKDGSRLYGEDYTLEGKLTNPVQTFRAQHIPVSFDITGDEPYNHASQGGPMPSGTGKMIYGAVLNQLYGTLSSQFQTIQIKIKGDPYWIGPGTFEESIARMSGQYNFGSRSKPNVGYSHGANLIYLRFKFPIGQDDNGDIILKDEESVSGLFQVNKVTHNFENGQFTQTIHCTRYQLMDMKMALTGEGGDVAVDVLKNSTNSANNNPPAGNVDPATKPSGSLAQRQKQAYDYFRSKGWSPEQAAAIVANLQYESRLNPGQPNESDGVAFGLAQWRDAGRVARFEQVIGVPLRGSSFDQQLEYVQWELTQQEYYKRLAGDPLKATTDLNKATFIIFDKYEAPGDSSYSKRLSIAKQILASYGAG